MQKYKYSVIAILVVFLFVSSCTPSQPSGSIFGPTFTPSKTPSLTPTNCPPVTLDRTPVPGTIKPYLILALFEDTPESRAQTNQDIEMLKDVFSEHSEPGDYILMMRMEPTTLSSATFFQEKITLVPPPPLPPLPTMYPTFTPIPPPTSTPDTTLGQTALANHVTQTVTASFPTASYQAFLHQCAMNAWEFQFMATQTSHDEAVEKAVKDSTGKIQNISATPISSTAVWNGLSHVTLVLENECDKYQRCIVLIFSDMDEVFYSPRETAIYLPLQNGHQEKVEILVSMRNCQFLFSGACNKWKSFWEDFFFSRSTPVFFVNSNVKETIESMLKR